jgi:hypothetical protein
LVASAGHAALSPRAALRTHALARFLVAHGHANAGTLAFHARFVAGVAASLGHSEPSLDERARRAHARVS